MQIASLIEFLDAAIYTKYVVGPYEERGGVMLVAYPGSFKTSIVNSSVQGHPDVMKTSDLNVQQWLKVKDDFITGRYTCLAFTDFEKIYQRHTSTAMHVEGIIKGLVAEGYGTGPSGDQRMPTILAYALVIGAMTNTCMESKYDDWQKSGFLRRFIWITYAVKNQNKIHEAIERWEKLDFGRFKDRPINSNIKAQETPPELSSKLRHMMQEQPGLNGTGYVLLQKIVSVLLWKYGANGKGTKAVMEILNDVAPSFSKDGGRITL